MIRLYITHSWQNKYELRRNPRPHKLTLFSTFVNIRYLIQPKSTPVALPVDIHRTNKRLVSAWIQPVQPKTHTNHISVDAARTNKRASSSTRITTGYHHSLRKYEGRFGVHSTTHAAVLACPDRFVKKTTRA